MPPRPGSHIVRGNDDERFASKTVIGLNGCIIWVASKNKDGYGKFATGKYGQQRHHAAHRWAFQRKFGYLPEVVRHRCDNPACVNVDHLEPGTQWDNVQDAIARGRRKALPASQVELVLDFIANGDTINAAAIKAGVVPSSAYALVRRISARTQAFEDVAQVVVPL